MGLMTGAPCGTALPCPECRGRGGRGSRMLFIVIERFNAIRCRESFTRSLAVVVRPAVTSS
jgi:hypothetical protein